MLPDMLSNKNDTVKISVVTVCFNSATTLEKTIKSVINQSYTNIEYIIIDGGSTDGTLDIIKKYEEYISYWVSEPDKGAYDAMNKGIAVATGELVNCLNSDDWYFDGVLKRVADKYQETNGDFLYGDMCVVDGNGNELQVLGSANADFNKMLYETIIYHPCCFIKTSILKSRPLDIKYPICADEDLFIDLYHQQYKFVYLGEGGITRFRLGGRSTTSPIDCPKEVYKIGKKHLRYYKNQPQYEIIKYNLRRVRMYAFLLETENQIGDSYKQKIKTELENNHVNKIIIFGAGKVGKILGKTLTELHFNFDIIDNNSTIQGTDFFSKKVLSPITIRPTAGTIVLVANSGDSSTMLNQLVDMGFKKNIDAIDFTVWCMYLAYLKYSKN